MPSTLAGAEDDGVKHDSFISPGYTVANEQVEATTKLPHIHVYVTALILLEATCVHVCSRHPYVHIICKESTTKR